MGWGVYNLDKMDKGDLMNEWINHKGVCTLGLLISMLKHIFSTWSEWMKRTCPAWRNRPYQNRFSFISELTSTSGVVWRVQIPILLSMVAKISVLGPIRSYSHHLRSAQVLIGHLSPKVIMSVCLFVVCFMLSSA